MDLYLYEQRLRDEVIYLHSLWRQGPPTATTTNKRNRIQNDNISNAPNKKNRTNDDDDNNNLRLSEPGPWPTPAQFPTPASSSVGPATAQEMATHYAALKLQHRASNAFRESFPKSDEYGGGDAKYRFFFRVFMEDGELRRYYEENSECGEFYCLVCCGLGQEKKKKKKKKKRNLGKMFKTCLGLVHHSARMAKTEGNFSHKAFAEVVCRVLGWDFDRLPIIVSKGEPLSRTLGKFECEGSCKDAKNIDKKEMIDGQGRKRPLVSSSEWPCEKPTESSPSAVLEWPPFVLRSGSAVSSLSAEERGKFDADLLQHKAVKACQDFLTKNSSAKSDDDEDEDASEDSDEDEDASEDNDEHDDEDGNTDASNNAKEFHFFLQLFIDNDKLREFYVKNFKGGEFCCLVCSGIGNKVWKRYIGCVALVQHSNSILKTKKKVAHRAYGKVICQVLGWDFNRFPSILLNGESHGQSLVKLDSLQGEPGENSDGHKNDLCCKNNLDSLDGDNNSKIVLEKSSE